jgi:hypothetical protein
MDQWILMVDGPLQVGVIYHVAAVPADWQRYRVNRVNPDLGTQRPDRGSSDRGPWAGRDRPVSGHHTWRRPLRFSATAPARRRAPIRRSLFHVAAPCCGVFAEFERAMIRERVLAGIARARDQGTQLGRRRLEDTDAKKVAAIRSARKKGVGIRHIARDLGVSVGTVLRLTAEP